MRRNNEFLLRDVAGALVIVPVGNAAANFPGMITINATGAFLWELLEDPQTVQTLTGKVMDRYEVEEQQAKADVEAFVKRLRQVGAIVDT